MYRLSIITIIAVYLLILLGGFVSSSGSGMGCGPDWPLCNGQLIPLLQGATLIEFGHRIVGAVIGLLTLMLAISYWRQRKQRPDLGPLMIGIIALLTIQILLGAVTVFYHIPASVITVHLGVAMLFLAGLIILLHREYSGIHYTKPAASRKFISLVTLSSLGTYFMILLGAAVKHTNAALACGWSDCYGSVLPATGPQLLQTTHRAGAFIVAALVIWTFIQSRREPLATNVRVRSGLALLAVVTQIALGILTIASQLKIGYAVSHLGVATLLFMILISLFTTEVILQKAPYRKSVLGEWSGSSQPVYTKP